MYYVYTDQGLQFFLYGTSMLTIKSTFHFFICNKRFRLKVKPFYVRRSCGTIITVTVVPFLIRLPIK